MMNLKRVERFLGLICFLSWKLCFLFSLLFIPFKFYIIFNGFFSSFNKFQIRAAQTDVPPTGLKIKIKIMVYTLSV